MDDPVMRWLIPDDVDYEVRPPGDLRQHPAGWLATDSLWCTDDAVAIAGWLPPGRPEVEVERVPPFEHPEWRKRSISRDRRRDSTSTRRPRRTGTSTCWPPIPTGSGRGWARALMAVVFEIADGHGLPCYLETETKENVGYYRHHGFEVRSEWDVPLDGPHMWGMLRPAR